MPKTPRTSRREGHLELKSRPSLRSGGFTLIEFAIVMLISGFLIVPLVQLYTQYMKQKVWDDTKAHVDLARTVIIDYQLNNNRRNASAKRGKMPGYHDNLDLFQPS